MCIFIFFTHRCSIFHHHLLKTISITHSVVTEKTLGIFYNISLPQYYYSTILPPPCHRHWGFSLICMKLGSSWKKASQNCGSPSKIVAISSFLLPFLSTKLPFNYLPVGLQQFLLLTNTSCDSLDSSVFLGFRVVAYHANVVLWYIQLGYWFSICSAFFFLEVQEWQLPSSLQFTVETSCPHIISED